MVIGLRILLANLRAKTNIPLMPKKIKQPYKLTRKFIPELNRTMSVLKNGRVRIPTLDVDEDTAINLYKTAEENSCTRGVLIDFWAIADPRYVAPHAGSVD